MNQTTWVFLGIVIVVLVAYLIITKMMKKKIFAQIISAVQNQDMDEVERITKKASTRYLIPPFNLEYLKLNAYILEGNKRKINDQFDLLIKNMRKNKAQTEDVTMKAFNYYVGMEDKHRTKELLEKIDTFTNVRMQEEAHMMYDIFIQKGFNYIEQMEEDLKNMNDAQKAINEYLLSVQYANKGDKEKAKEYEDLSRKHMNEPLPKNK